MARFWRRCPVLTVVLALFFLLAAGTAGLILLSLTAGPPENSGVHDGRLAACPDSPNCVSTQAEDREHWIAPLDVTSKAIQPIELLAEIVRELPRATIVEQTNDYLRVEFRSRIFRFCDDVEFYVEPQSNRVHFRSASRVGHSDLGVNRDRMELIRQKFLEASKTMETGQTPAARKKLRDTRPLAGSR